MRQSGGTDRWRAAASEDATAARSGVRRRFPSQLVLRPCAAALVCWLGLAGAAQCQGRTTLEYEVKAAFLYNFAKFVDWTSPAGDKATGPIGVCVLGKDPFGSVLDETLRGKTVNGRPLEAVRIAGPPLPRECRILFVPGAETDRFREMASTAERPGLLTVGESPKFLASGGIINFTLEQNKVRFEVNVAAAPKGHMKLSSKLLRLAKAVKTGRCRGAD